MTEKQWAFVFGTLRFALLLLILIVKMNPATARTVSGKNLEREYFEFLERWEKL